MAWLGFPLFRGRALVGSLLPLAVGMLIGNLDREIRKFLGQASPVLIPFFAFALGGTLDLAKVWQAGLLGLLMGVAVVVVTGPLFFADHLTGGSGVAGMAAASTAGNAAAVGHCCRGGSRLSGGFRTDDHTCSRLCGFLPLF